MQSTMEQLDKHGIDLVAVCGSYKIIGVQTANIKQQSARGSGWGQGPDHKAQAAASRGAGLILIRSHPSSSSPQSTGLAYTIAVSARTLRLRPLSSRELSECTQYAPCGSYEAICAWADAG